MSLFSIRNPFRAQDDLNGHDREHEDFARRMTDMERRLRRLSDVVAVVQRDPESDSSGPVVEH